MDIVKPIPFGQIEESDGVLWFLAVSCSCSERNTLTLDWDVGAR